MALPMGVSTTCGLADGGDLHATDFGEVVKAPRDRLLGMTKNGEGRDSEGDECGGEEFHVHNSIRKRSRVAADTTLRFQRSCSVQSR